MGLLRQAATEWLDYWDRRGKRSRLAIDLETTQAKLEDFVVATPGEQLCEWTNPVDSPLPLTVLKTAVAWSEQRKLRDRVRKVNVEHGTPVRSEAVADHFNASLRQQELAEYCNPRTRESSGHQAVVLAMAAKTGRENCFPANYRAYRFG